MIKKEIKTKNRSKVYLEYDETKYDIEYFCEESFRNNDIKDFFVIKRLSDNKVIKILPGEIGFIVQTYFKDNSYFMVTDYSEKDKWDSSIVSLCQYEESEYWDSLYLNESFKGDTPSISRRLADHTYVATSDTYGTYLYNLEKKSKLYNRIYQSEELTEIFGEPIIFVSEHRTATYNHKIRDNITYGINPDTYEIITPIYSELQERFIPIHTQEELEIINRNRRKNGEYEYNIHNFSPSEVTITCEIQETLDKLDDILPKAPNIYEDSLQRKINEEFVRKFKK